MPTPSWLPGGWLPGDALPIVEGTDVDSIVTLIARRLRRTVTSGSNIEVEIISEILHAQRKLEEGPTLPWFLRNSATVTVDPATADDAAEVAFNDTGYSIIRMQDDLPLQYTDPEGVADELIEVPLEAEKKILLQKHPGDGLIPLMGHQEPTGYIVRPTPTQAITYTLRFYHHDTEPVLGGATQWTANFPDLIMNLAGYEMAWSLRDEMAMQRFADDVKIARDRYVKIVQAREDAGQRHVMGDD